MLIADDFADAIRIALNFPSPVTKELKGWAQGIIDEIQISATVNNTTGTIQGITSVGAPLTAGSASGGLISSMSGSSMASLIANGAEYGSVTGCLNSYAEAIVTHIQTFGTVSFFPGTIQGVCTNTILSPGPLAAGLGSGGKITGLNGLTLATAIATSCFDGTVSPELLSKSSAMVDYIMSEAEVEYTVGSIIGICPPGGGPLTAGTGLNGKIL